MDLTKEEEEKEGKAESPVCRGGEGEGGGGRRGGGAKTGVICKRGYPAAGGLPS